MSVSRRWRKSGRSQNGGDCVEVAHTLDAVRDSKNPAGPVLEVAGLSAFLAEVKRCPPGPAQPGGGRLR